MSLQGLPDFHRPIRGDRFSIYFPFEGHGGAHAMILTPSGLELGCQADGSPDLSIEYVTRRDEKYGILSFSVRPRYPDPEVALALARQAVPQATITYSCFTGGYLRLWLLGHLAELDPEASKVLSRPQPLGWNELESGKFRALLSEEAIDHIKKALLESNAPITSFSAYAEMEIVGVPPRLKVRATFDPAELLPALVPGFSEDNRTLSHNALIQRFTNRLGSVPIKLEGEGLDVASPMELAEVLTDRLRVRYGQFVPADQPSEDTCFRLPPRPEIARGRVTWKLEEPFRAPRPVVIKLHPLEQAQRFVKAKGLQAVFKTRIPELDTGVLKLTIRINVPPAIPQIEAIGIDIYSPPSAYRRQPIRETRELTGPEYKDSVTLRFSPREEKKYKCRCYAVLKEGRVLKTDDNAWDGVPFHTESDLDISVSDLPFKLIWVKADDSLLREASIYGRCTWNEEGEEHSHEFSIHAPNGQDATIVVPRPAAESTKLLIEARQIGTDKKVRFQAEPASKMQLGLYSFREWGPRSVEVECRFTDCIREVLVEFLPEGAPEHNAKSLKFDASRPKRKWTWIPDSMFAPGYRYRVQALGAGAKPSAWLMPQALFETLIVDFNRREENHD